MRNGNLYLIPTKLGDTPNLNKIIPEFNYQIIYSLRYFIVEKIRTARRFLVEINHPILIDDIIFFELNKHTQMKEIVHYLDAVKKGFSIGLISEAGTPAVADPGSVIVSMAHQKNIKVVPLVGPNSILLSLMASGMNGQQFVFHGYLPKEGSLLFKKIKEMELEVIKKGITQIFIETPFRNNKLINALVEHCKPQTLLCMAMDVTLPGERIETKTIAQWKKEKADLNKKPAVFLLGR